MPAPRSRLSTALCCLLGLFATYIARAVPSIDTQELIHESQRLRNEDHKITFVWWIPSQFWRVSLEKEATMSPQALDRFSKVIINGAIMCIPSAEEPKPDTIASSVKIPRNPNQKHMNTRESVLAHDPIARQLNGSIGSSA